MTWIDDATMDWLASHRADLADDCPEDDDHPDDSVDPNEDRPDTLD